MITPLVLGYHRVIPYGEARRATPWPVLDIPVKRFALHLEAALRSGYVITDPLALVEGTYSTNSLFLSFDDGYLQTLIVAEQALRHLPCPQRFMLSFITGRAMNGEGFPWDHHHPHPSRCTLVRKEHLSSLSRFVRFGWHGRTHASLDGSCTNILSEMTPPQEITSLLPLFAYPYGHEQHNVSDQARSVCLSRYAMGFTLFSTRLYLSAPCRSLVPRLYVSRYWSANEFVERLDIHRGRVSDKSI